MQVLEDVPLYVGKFFNPCDFLVMEMGEDAQISIILGRPFLATNGAMKNGKLSLQVIGKARVQSYTSHGFSCFEGCMQIALVFLKR